MLTRIQHLRRDERGLAFVYVGLGFMGFLAATTLAIDVGMIMTARSQAQNAADAGAHAGAVALVFNSYTDRSASGPAVQSAINAALGNQVIGAPVSVGPADVTFPTDPSGQANRVRVDVYRTSDRGNPVPALMGTLFGVDTVNINATATAEASPANAMSCVKPFMIPDKWTENSDQNGAPDGAWTPNSTFDLYDKHDNPLLHPDVYIDATHDPGYTGYTVENDVGTELVLRAGTGDQINPSFYYSWKMPGDVGGDFYRENIAACNQSIITFGTPIVQEPGDKTGPTIQGIEDLIARDPGAYWDTVCDCVKNSAFGTSPRVFPIPLYDPWFYANGKANGRPADFRVANFLGFFADHVNGNQIFGRITNVVGLVHPDAGPAPAGAFPKAIRLVQ
jgi:Flp pilus assembly protein TadG